MRKNPTHEESILWEAIKKNQLGVKFRRQHIIDQFIVDFYSIEAQLILEVDGEIHTKQQERDAERTIILQSLGLTVLRFTNDQIKNNLEEVLSTIKKLLSKSPLGDLGAQRSHDNV